MKTYDETQLIVEKIVRVFIGKIDNDNFGLLDKIIQIMPLCETCIRKRITLQTLKNENEFCNIIEYRQYQIEMIVNNMAHIIMNDHDTDFDVCDDIDTAIEELLT